MLFLLACSEYTLPNVKNQPGADDTGSSSSTDSGLSHSQCEDLSAPAVDVGPSDTCPYNVGGFEPIVDWSIPGTSLAMPAVADLDGDGMPEVIANIIDSILPVPGRLQVWRGDGSGMVWQDTVHAIAYGGHPAVGDIDGDGHPEVLETIQYQDNLFGAGEFSVAAWSWDGRFLGESDHFRDYSFDHATGLIISDMDHDGSPEIIAGRAILRPDLSTRGIGRVGRGATMGAVGSIAEGSHPAVADLDLDGQEEVIVGNGMYDADGNTLGGNPMNQDGSPSVVNLDSDPEGEVIISYGNTYRAQDTDGQIIWGPETIASGNILSSPAIGDLDGDGLPELVVAGGGALKVLHAVDGSVLWAAQVRDESGATGASIFDFDGDGVPEVVYIDEIEMTAYNGSDGTIKFHSTEHGSVTMYDYPVIADVDNDGHAEILVANQSNNEGIVVYKDKTNSWAPARKVWNQHAYSITNINDDLSIPINAVPNFTIYNNYHSALALAPGQALGDDLQAEIVSICEEDCAAGWLRVVLRVLNHSTRDIPAGIQVAIYAQNNSGNQFLGTAITPAVIPAGYSSEGLVFSAPADAVRDAQGILVVADDDGTGVGQIIECAEDDNAFGSSGSFCE